MNRRTMLAMSFFGMLLAPQRSNAEGGNAMTLQLIKDPNCGCCGNHAQYLRDHGYVVEVSESDRLAELRAELGVPEQLAGCHTIRAEGYVIEGHVPAAALDKLLAERPLIKGISVPGMPAGSPGMDGEKTEPLAVFVIDDGTPRIFMTE
jgi:hypothetical protein